MQIRNGHFLFGDCFDHMAAIADGSVDMVLCDLPYGTTRAQWDRTLPAERLWCEYRRIVKKSGVVVLTAAQPFTSALVMSNPSEFRYDWVWLKNAATGQLRARKQPLKNKEDILVFSQKPEPRYNPQGLVYDPQPTRNGRNSGGGTTPVRNVTQGVQEFTNWPKQTLEFKTERGFHPTQKPVALFDYLIRTYTDPGDLVLDNCAGSGTTAVACEQNGRRWLCIEADAEYYWLAAYRVMSL